MRDDGDDNINVYVFQSCHAYYALYENKQNKYNIIFRSGRTHTHSALWLRYKHEPFHHNQTLHQYIHRTAMCVSAICLIRMHFTNIFINISPSKYTIRFVSVDLIQQHRLQN